MAERHVGLDIGSFAVRAAEVSGEPGNLTLHRFAQLTLPVGAVVDGEIMDPPAVSASIKALWDKGGFKSKKVVVGVGNRWVKVRQAEVPALAREDVRSSLRYEAQEVIPFADEDAIVDFVVQDRFQGPDGGEFLRILVVAAQRQMVSTMLETVRKAGLTAALVDLTPFALVRSLAPVAGAGVSEAIVSVGAGLTNVVVHTSGTPRLARMTPRAGAAVTENLTRTLGVDAERAEALKRGAGAGSLALADPQTAQAADLIAGELDPLVQEIQGSLDYFLAQTDDVELRRVLLTGAGSKMAGLRNRLAAELRVPVEMGSPLDHLRLGKTGLSDEQLAAAAAVMAAPVGLAMAPTATPATKLTSLFPVEFHEATAYRRHKVVTAAAVAAVAVALGGAWGMRQAQVVDARGQAAQAEREAVTIERQVQKLRPFEVAEAQVNSRRTQAQVALAGDVDMVTFLDRLTTNLPGDVGLTSITVTAGGAPAVPAAVGAPPTLGSVTVAAVGRTQDSAAHWITRMRELNVLTGVWVPSSTKTGAAPGSGTVTFSGNADLSPAANSGRANTFKAAQ